MNSIRLNELAAQSPAGLPNSLDWHMRRERSCGDYAGFWRRYLASFIDGLLVGIVARLAVSLTGFNHELHFEGAQGDRLFFLDLNSAFFVALTLGWLYHAGFESSSRQATFGKGIVGIIVTDLGMQRISFGRASARYFASLLSTLLILLGYLIQPFTEKRQTLHDIIAGTLVVKS